MPKSGLYERDFHAWANEQAALPRAGALNAADIENIAEEIESMGRSEKRELVNRLAALGATGETGLDDSTFPATCPWSFEQIMDDGFWPENRMS